MEKNKRYVVVNLVSAVLFGIGFVIQQSGFMGLALGMAIRSNVV